MIYTPGHETEGLAYGTVRIMQNGTKDAAYDDFTTADGLSHAYLESMARFIEQEGNRAGGVDVARSDIWNQLFLAFILSDRKMKGIDRGLAKTSVDATISYTMRERYDPDADSNLHDVTNSFIRNLGSADDADLKRALRRLTVNTALGATGTLEHHLAIHILALIDELLAADPDYADIGVRNIKSNVVRHTSEFVSAPARRIAESVEGSRIAKAIEKADIQTGAVFYNQATRTIIFIGDVDDDGYISYRKLVPAVSDGSGRISVSNASEIFDGGLGQYENIRPDVDTILKLVRPAVASNTSIWSVGLQVIRDDQSVPVRIETFDGMDKIRANAHFVYVAQSQLPLTLVRNKEYSGLNEANRALDARSLAVYEAVAQAFNTAGGAQMAIDLAARLRPLSAIPPANDRPGPMRIVENAVPFIMAPGAITGQPFSTDFVQFVKLVTVAEAAEFIPGAERVISVRLDRDSLLKAGLTFDRATGVLSVANKIFPGPAITIKVDNIRTGSQGPLAGRVSLSDLKTLFDERKLVQHLALGTLTAIDRKAPREFVIQASYAKGNHLLSLAAEMSELSSEGLDNYAVSFVGTEAEGQDAVIDRGARLGIASKVLAHFNVQRFRQDHRAETVRPITIAASFFVLAEAGMNLRLQQLTDGEIPNFHLEIAFVMAVLNRAMLLDAQLVTAIKSNMAHPELFDGSQFVRVATGEETDPAIIELYAQAMLIHPEDVSAETRLAWMIMRALGSAA